MTLFCEAGLINRQNMYKTYLHYNPDKINRKDQVMAAVLSVLETRKGLSGTQVYKELLRRGVIVGRDMFYSIINRYKLTFNARKRAWKKRRVKSKPAKNIVVNHTFHRVYEVLFADYTEIITAEGKLQLLIVMDLISRFITAFRISATCTAAPVIEAVKESLALKAFLKLRYQTILHTDKGSEFVNNALKKTAEENNLLLSNTGINHCYDNAFMESLNRTLKHSLGLRVMFDDKAEALACIQAAVSEYNNEHRHSKLGKRTPYCVLMGYTGKYRGKPDGKTYSKTLVVKIKKIRIDKHKTITK